MPAHAALIDNGDFTTDSTTNLQWLDLTLTRGRSYNDVASQFGAGGEFEGWRHATFSDLNTLFVSLGYSANYLSSPATPGMLANILLFGITQSRAVPTGAAGVFDDSASGSSPSDVGWAILHTEADISNLDGATIVNDEFTADTASFLQGNWLIRSTATEISEPGTALIMALGIMGIYFRRRARQAA